MSFWTAKIEDTIARTVETVPRAPDTVSFARSLATLITDSLIDGEIFIVIPYREPASIAELQVVV